MAHWVAKKNRGWGLDHLKKQLGKSSHVAVTTRSGRVVEEDVEEEEEVESDPIAPVDEGEGVSPSDDGG